MEDDKFIKELKESATRKRLPTVSELGNGYKSPLKEIEGTSEQESSQSDVEYKQDDEKKQVGSEEYKKELLDKTRSMYNQGKTPEDVMQALRNMNYSYEDIEDAIMKITEEEAGELKSDSEVEGEETPRKEERLSEIEEIERRLDAPSPKEEESRKTEQFISDEKMEYAPLFIKVEKYRETLETVEDLENYLKAMSKLFEIVNELERIRMKNISALTKMYNRAMQTASKLYGGLLKPKGMKFEGSIASESEIEKIDLVVRDLNEELQSLRAELDKIRNVE